jgi:hypothetical protein
MSYGVHARPERKSKVSFPDIGIVVTSGVSSPNKLKKTRFL